MYSLFITTLACIMCMLSNTQHKDTYLGVQTHEIEKQLNTHLNSWYPAIIDTENGGYFTNFNYNWTLDSKQPKMLVTQARALWTASKAAQMFPDNHIYKKAAQHGFEFITKEMWDNENSGFNLYHMPDGQAGSTYKLIYANAFALFAFAEYAKINPSDEANHWLQKTFNWIEGAGYDHLHGGYFNLLPNKELIDQLPNSIDEIRKLGWGNHEWKDQNTTIHLLEAYTTLYQVMPLPEVREKLEYLMLLIRDKMITPNGTLRLFFTRNWHPIDYSDSTRTYILDNQFFDHVSFGHDIETAYLLMDASNTLYGKIDPETLEAAIQLTEHTLQNGFAPDFYGIYDRGYYFGNELEIIDERKSWWAQFEALNTLAILAELFPNEQVYEIAFRNMWTYITNELADYQYGGFFEYGIDITPAAVKMRKGHNWKGAYHDGRALMLLWEYAHGKLLYLK